MTIDLTINGDDALERALSELRRDYSGSPEKVVGTNVEYAIHLEFGTRPHTITPTDAEVLRFEADGEEVFAMEVQHPGIDPKPFLRPPVNDARRNPGEFIRTNTQTALEELGSAEEVVEALALAVERKVKQTITQKGLIDTGTLRASIRTADTAAELPSVEDV